MDAFDFENVDALSDYIQGSALAHPDLALAARTTYTGDGILVARYVDVSLHAVTHEMAHVIDFYRRGQTERYGRYGFGLSYPELTLLDQTFPNPTNTRGILCECRVFAMQAVLLREHLGFDLDVADFFADSARLIAASSLELPDALLIPRRRAITRHMNAEERRFRKAQHRGEEARGSNPYLNPSVCSYRQDRLEYALKHMVRGYQNERADAVLADYREAISMLARYREEPKMAA
ncbi:MULTISPECIES: hypothetical protein [unclassified Thioalkalivibrio]|uniref:hypothetical protein n=1 Tax=unclassified Thioalkalivibrio TaxID=2621013 RepID=UPI000381A9CB|nr:MULTISPECIES: hypothetical protein [unclassified Thioalkalivibrio]